MAHAILIRVSRDGGPAKTYAFDKDVVRVGRDPASDVYLADPAVSRLHCRLERGDGGYAVSDQGSANGTRVNDAGVRWRELESGDAIRIEGYTLWVELVNSTDSRLRKDPVADDTWNRPTLKKS